MRRSRWRRPAVAVAIVLLAGLPACTPGSPQPSGGDTVPTSAAATTAPASTLPVPAPADYSGPSPMPASDGGPMLWPTTSIRTVYLEGWTTEQTRYGFVDTTGALVVPPRYDWYEYCRDADGRAALVLAGSAEDQADILDLSGRVVGEVPGRFAGCIGDTHAEFQKEASETGPAEVGTGLFDLRSGEVVIPVRRGRAVMMVDRRTVNVHQAEGEYFLDLVTGSRTPHPGYADVQDLGDDAELIPAGISPAGTYTDEEAAPLVGYLDREGGWALEPSLTGAGPFRAGYAVVREGATEHFIDTSFRRVGEDWSWISDLDQGYQVARESGGVELTGLLGLDLRVIVEPVDAAIECGWGSEIVCSIHPGSGRPKIVLLPEGTVTDPPEGFGEALSRKLFTDATGDVPATRVHNVTIGTTFALDRPSYCEATAAWVTCRPAEDGPPPIVYSSSGERTAFREVTAIEDAVAGTDSGYSWTVAGRYQGFIDPAGNWLYRQSRYTDLED